MRILPNKSVLIDPGLIYSWADTLQTVPRQFAFAPIALVESRPQVGNIIMTAAVEENPEQAKPGKTKYHVESVEKVDTPEGMPEGNWCRYIIGSGASKIEGMKPGTIKAVTAHAELVAEDLNSRTSRVKATYAASKTTKPAQTPKPAQPTR